MPTAKYSDENTHQAGNLCYLKGLKYVGSTVLYYSFYLLLRTGGMEVRGGNLLAEKH